MSQPQHHQRIGIFLAIAIILSGGVLYFVLKSDKKSKTSSPSPATGVGTSNTGWIPVPVSDPILSSTSIGSGVFPLKMGSTGDEVKQLQAALKQGLVIDGIFGVKTQAALVAKTGKATVDTAQELNAITRVI